MGGGVFFDICLWVFVRVCLGEGECVDGYVQGCVHAHHMGKF